MKRVKKEMQFVGYSLTLYQVLHIITSNPSHVSTYEGNILMYCEQNMDFKLG